MLDAAAAQLVEHGYAAFTVSAVAERAGSSKGTVYSWYGNRDGLLRAVIARNYTPPNLDPNTVFPRHADPRTVLTNYVAAMITIVQGDLSLALNRTAMGEAAFGPILLENGGDRGRALLAEYLADITIAGHISVDDPVAAAKVLYGLGMQDDQIRLLLGDAPIGSDPRARAEFAADAFLKIYAPE